MTNCQKFRYTGCMLGVFDSGAGGLTVLSAIRDRLPDLSITYLGDSARTPYGNQSREVVTKNTKECCRFLFDRGCNLILLACNTASADTLRELQQEWLPKLREEIGRNINIIGVVRPLAEEASSKTKNNCIGVVGTRSTVESEVYLKEFEKLNPAIRVVQQACPLLVPLVEEGWVKKPEARRIIRGYLQSIKSSNPDVLILGCTHYEALHAIFKQKMGSRCEVLHSPSVVAEKLGEYLNRHTEYEIERSCEVKFLTTGDPDRFAEIGSRFYGERILGVERVEIPC